MEILLISYPTYFNGEIDLIHNMFDEGLTVFHLRKPDYNENQLTEFLDRIKPEFHSRIKVHSTFLGFFNRFMLGGIHIPGAISVNSNIINLKKDKNISISSSFHSFDEAIRDNEHFDYAFLSPVFDSISKKNYKSRFDFNELSKGLAQANIRLMALGGCKAENLNQVKQLGFSGAAVLGAVWNSADPFNSYIEIKEAAAGL
jgi:thiamine-phosphate pyrophosphorylase